MYDRELCCCFTGHRPAKLPWGSNEADERCLALKDELSQRLMGIYESGYRHFISGMAIGCDLYFAEAVLALREIHSDVSLEAAIPCGTQPDKWPKSQRIRYNKILDSCDHVNVLQVNYTPDCMMRRNRHMVDKSSLLLACYDGKPGGTMNTILYAKRQGLKTIIIEV